MDVIAHALTQPKPFGVVTLETMPRAEPLVSITIRGPAEVVLNGTTGILVEPGKPELPAEAICGLLASLRRVRERDRPEFLRLLSGFGM